jgi:glutamate formiminotransferase
MATIECILNVSEGRRTDVLISLANALRNTPNLCLLDQTSDPDHNRSVFSFIGDATALLHGILTVYELAVTKIDLRQHSGVHPRIGAVDVVPFVPISRATVPECVKLARLVASTIAKRFDIPSFLYEKAATHPSRRDLSNIRRGGIETLSDKMTKPPWRPDFGPLKPHPSAGISVIGCREPLIAWNINLDSKDVTNAQQIARRIRRSSGGLPHVRAIGVRINSRQLVQVSINLANYRATTMSQVMAMVEQEAARLDVPVAYSEIIGLAPTDALPESTSESLKLDKAVQEYTLEPKILACRQHR